MVLCRCLMASRGSHPWRPARAYAESAARQRGTREEEEPNLESESGGDHTDYDDPFDPADARSLTRQFLPLPAHAAQPRRCAASGLRPPGEFVVCATQAG